MRGRIVKGIAGFYYIYAEDEVVYECKAKGIFRKDKRKPMIGDYVQIDILDEDKRLGNITELLARNNELIRPAVSNVDQALVIFAHTQPEPNLMLLDKMLLQFLMQKVQTIICFNKGDLATEDEATRLGEIYSKCGCRVIFTCAASGEGISELKECLLGKTTCVAGPSGVGKSSIINCLQSDVKTETGVISQKAMRGKHTTRHSEIIPVCEDTYIIDTPGFSSLNVFLDDCEELKQYYDEFLEYDTCRFTPCSHTHEPECAVKQAVSDGFISKQRYDNYAFIYDELKNLRRY